VEISRTELIGTHVAQLGRTDMTKAAFKKVLEEILDVPPGSLKEGETRDSIEGWSSLTDVQILTAIWSELQLEVDPDEFAFESVGELLSLLEANQAFSAY
jgi:acyl carrier protein